MVEVLLVTRDGRLALIELPHVSFHTIEIPVVRSWRVSQYPSVAMIPDQLSRRRFQIIDNNNPPIFEEV